MERLFKKLDYWSVTDSLSDIIEYEYQDKKSIYFDFYEDQIREMGILAADMFNELDRIKSDLWTHLPVKKGNFYMDDDCELSSVAWFNTCACLNSDIDMMTLLDNEERFVDDFESEKTKRINQMKKLTKEEYFYLTTTVLNFLNRYMQLLESYHVIKSVIDELDYHQSVINGKNIMLSQSAYI